MKYALAAALICAMVITGAAWFDHSRNQKQIAEVTADRDQFQAQVKERQETIDGLTAEIDGYQSEKGELLAQIEANKQDIANYQKQLQERKLEIADLDSTSAVLDAFRQAFPLVARAHSFGTVDLYDEENDVTIEYAAVPAFALEVFVEYKAEADNRGRQLAEYQANEKLCDQERVLQAQIDTLQREKEQQYIDLTQEYQARYDAMVEKLLAELGKPRIKVPAWKATLLLGGLCVLSGNTPW